MTLRKLAWMAGERARVMGLLAAWHLAGICAHMPFVNARLEPAEINPFKPREPENPAVERIKRFIARRRFAAMCRAIGD